MTVIIPAYKPDEKLIGLIHRLQEMSSCRILVVNDGSGEAYQAIFSEAEALGCTLLVHPENRGKGAALKTAFVYLSEHGDPADVIATADADGQHLPTDIFACLAEAKLHPEALILGSRGFTGDVPARSRFGNTVSRWTFHLLMGVRVFDTQTGLRAFHASLLPQLIAIQGDRYEYEMKMLCEFAAKKIPIREIEIRTVYLDEKNSSSHFNPLADAKRVYGILLKNACSKTWQVLTFLFSSLFALGVDLFSYWVFFNLFENWIPQLNILALVSLLLARTLSSATNYAMNRNVVFRSHSKLSRTMVLYFLLVCAVFFGNHFLNAKLFLDILEWHEIPSLLAAQTICFPISFLLQKYVVFPSKKRL